MKKLAWLAAAFAAALGVHSFAKAACTSASTQNGHYYAYIDSTPLYGADRGALINIYTTELTAHDPYSQLVTHEMWYGGTSGCHQWVEVGVTDGLKAGGGTVNQSVFWADSRAPYPTNYHEHYSSMRWDMNRYYQARVAWAGVTGQWNVYFGGVFLGTSTNNSFGGDGQRCVKAGIETGQTPIPSDATAGHLWAFQREDAQNNWHPDWGVPKSWCVHPALISLDGNFSSEGLYVLP